MASRKCSRRTRARCASGAGPAVAPVADGQTPPGTRVEYTDYETRIEEYVHVVELTDQVADTHLDPVLQERTDALGEANKQTVELVSISVLSGGTQAMYAGGTTRDTVNAPPTNGDFIKILRAMDNALAQPISKIIAASGNVATQPVEAGFYAFCHTNLQADLEHITGFTKKINYANPGIAVPGEFGALGRIRFIATPNFKPWLLAGVSGSTYLNNNGTGTGKCDVYPIIIFGRDAYGTVSLRGYESAKIYVLAPGEARGGDPAAQ
ncbi:MAG: N4-gp56 family major capsid protein, partial [Kiritimatiellaeota bacterium]|nr:N4-gp56 family major capsid protein [Kiritimatiellota bacterium]